MTQEQRTIVNNLFKNGWEYRESEGSVYRWPSISEPMPECGSNQFLQGISLYEGSGDGRYDEPTVHGHIKDPETEEAVIQYLRETLGYN